MKPTKLNTLSDNQKFKLSKKKKAPTYRLQRLDKKSKTATYSSLRSKLTFERSWSRVCFLLK